jgi:predicted methyltransferase
MFGVLSACRAEPQAPRFPEAERPVAAIVSDSFSTEEARDRLGEADEVVAFAQIRPGMSIADIGAGEGYYTVRLSPVVGPRGRVLAQDIIPATRDRLAQRVERDKLDNVSVRLGLPDDPRIPAASFDRIFLVHMYHEVTAPYAFLWHLRAGLRPGGEIIVVDADREIRRHGMPRLQLACEFAALGLQQQRIETLTGSNNYAAAFRIARARPDPETIERCPSKK